MKAARLEDGTLQIQDLPIPEPGVEEALSASAPPACATPTSTSPAATGPACPGSGCIGHEAIGVVEALGPGAERYVSVGDRVILGLGGAGGGYWCGACRYCLSGQTRLCTETKHDHGHVRRALRGVGARAREDPRQPGRPRGAARLRRPHRVRRGQEAPRAPRAPRATDRDHRRRRRSRPLRGADRQRVRLPGRSASTSAPTASTS